MSLKLPVGLKRMPDARPPNSNYRIDHHHWEAQAIFYRAAIFVGPLVAVAAKKLVNQVTIGGMDFHPIETGTLGILRADPELLD